MHLEADVRSSIRPYAHTHTKQTLEMEISRNLIKRQSWSLMFTNMWHSCSHSMFFLYIRLFKQIWVMLFFFLLYSTNSSISVDYAAKSVFANHSFALNVWISYVCFAFLFRLVNIQKNVVFVVFSVVAHTVQHTDTP